MSKKQDKVKTKNSFFDRMLNRIEVVGNRLPDPIVLFAIMALAILVISALSSFFNVSAISPVDGEEIIAKNLLSRDGILEQLTGMVKNFSDFPPLGAVLVIMLGVGLADESGYFKTLMRRAVLSTPKKIIIPMIVLIGIIGNVAGDATQVVLPPLAATILMSFGYHPFVGLIAAYASTLGAFSANILIGMTDTLAAGFTEIGAQTVDPSFVANPAMNYYFIAVSTFFLLAVGTWVTYKFTIPRYGAFEGDMLENEAITPLENKGLRWANISVVAVVAILLIGVIPVNGWLRNAETGSIIQDSPLMASVVPLVMILFLVPGIFYGIGAQTIKSSKDFAQQIGRAMSSMGPYIVLVFVSAQMLAYFNASNLGAIISIKGANFLDSIGFKGIPLFVSFILFVALVNLLIGSASAKWAILAPIFVPMFMYLDYHPAFTQMMYRIGDSITNPITPMFPYLVLILAFAQKFDKKAGLGTLIAGLFPYSVFYGIFWIILLVVWYLLGIPVGPDAPIFLNK
ncbi:MULTISPECIES: AbgT family transporter [Sporosarcina]|uniref:Aminobenzoyl-glutamate transport protein n=1 Tax=Sporosarcina newyorkensis TaxID=759851 RepID=A0A1T4YXS1_9BACL|nr:MULTISPECIES: AbgT family transporter [Sporosarcina]MBY0223420.1 AbgT family transporter [Sporosarcina aquimarina]SKB06574.1 aminobenzoyl-glutamate transport protein [Sporosarcina newyorkensis]